MKYILIDWKMNGVLKDNGNETSTQPISIVVGIEGDTYGFVAPNPEKNLLNVIVPNKSLDLDQLREFVTTKAIEFVKNTYPNT